MGLSWRIRSRSSASDLADADRVGWIEEANDLIQCFPERLFGLFDSSSSASYSKVFAVGFSITCSVRFLEVDEGLPRPINRGQFGVDGDEDGHMIVVVVCSPHQSPRCDVSRFGSAQSITIPLSVWSASL